MTHERDRYRTSRRTALKTIGSGLLLGAATVPASARPGGHPGQGSSALAGQLDEVRAATREYRDVHAALADGYVPLSPYVPNMGFHFGQVDRSTEPPTPLIFGDEREDPGILVYFTNGSYDPAPGEPFDDAHVDDLILGAVEYLVPGDQAANPPDVFDDEDARRNLKVTEEDGWHYHPPEEEGGLEFTALHAWVHRGNPAGVFHGTNPTIDGNNADHGDHDH